MKINSAQLDYIKNPKREGALEQVRIARQKSRGSTQPDAVLVVGALIAAVMFFGSAAKDIINFEASRNEAQASQKAVVVNIVNLMHKEYSVYSPEKADLKKNLTQAQRTVGPTSFPLPQQQLQSDVISL